MPEFGMNANCRSWCGPGPVLSRPMKDAICKGGMKRALPKKQTTDLEVIKDMARAKRFCARAY